MTHRRPFLASLLGLLALLSAAHADAAPAAQNAAPPAPAAAAPPGSGPGCAPNYPDMSRRLGEAGDVVVGYDIGADGALANLRVIYSSGYARLDQAALACIATAPHAAPPIENGVPAASPGHRTIVSYSLGTVSAERLFQHGMAQETMGDHASAIEAFSQAIAMDAGDAQTYRARARAYEATGQHDLAAADTAKADALEKAR